MRALPRLGGLRHSSRLATARSNKSKEIDGLVEVIQLKNFRSKLENGSVPSPTSGSSAVSLNDAAVTKDEFLLAIDAGMACFALHIESRIASLLGASSQCHCVLKYVVSDVSTNRLWQARATTLLVLAARK